MNENSSHLSNKEKTDHLIWEGISICIESSYAYKDSSLRIIHLKIQSENKVALPITNTGYLSAFPRQEAIMKYGGVVPFVERWLEEQSQSKEWKLHVAEEAQQKLF